MAKGQAQETKQKAKAAASGQVTDRAAKVRKEILSARDNIEHGFIDLASLLSEAYHKDFHLQWGFETWEEYCNSELDTNYRKAMYLIDVWDKCKQYKLPKREVVKLGWTKMKDIAAVLTEKNAKQWLAKAKEMNTRELTEAVKTHRRKDLKGKDIPVMTTMTFRMSEAEASAITEALEQAKKLCESDNAVVALEMICQDWMMEKGATPERTDLKAHVAFLETAYGVKITHKKATKKQKEKAAKDKEKESKAAEGEETGDDLLAELGLTEDE
jgi:hypothetical protein